MFIKVSAAARLFKEAYKGVGLRIANTGHGIVLTGRAWRMFVFDENLPKKLKGEIIKLTGFIPNQGEQSITNKDGTQMELYLADPSLDVYARAMEAQAEGKDIWHTDIIITDDLERPYRVYRSEHNVYVIPEAIRDMINSGCCEQYEEMYGAFEGLGSWMYWISSYMAFGWPAFTADDAVKARALRLNEAGIF